MNFIKDQIRTIKKKDPAFKNNFEVILYPSFWAIMTHRLAHSFYKNNHYFLARFISQLSRFATGIEIHPGAKIGKGLFIDHGAGVVIGETAIIGNDVLIYQGVTLGGTGKDIGKRHPTIGNGVMIGAGVKILGPFKVGDGSRIGAGSVVLHEVPPHCTVVGVPARIVKRKDIKRKMDCLDQVQFPDPVENEISELRKRVDKLEKSVEKTDKKTAKKGEVNETV